MSSPPPKTLTDVAAEEKSLQSKFIRDEDERPKVAYNQFSSEIPVISLAGIDDGRRVEICKKIVEACEDWGIFQVIDHGVDTNLISEMTRNAREFFALPAQEKLRFDMTGGKKGGFIVSSHLQGEAVQDWREIVTYFSYPIGNRDYTRWPDKPETWRKVTEEYSDKVMGLACKLLGILSEAMGLDTDALTKACVDMDQKVVVNFYKNNKNFLLPKRENTLRQMFATPSFSAVKCKALGITSTSSYSERYFSLKPYTIESLSVCVRKPRIKCEIESSKSWNTVDYVSIIDPLHFVPKSPVSMTSTAVTLNSAVKSSKKVCLFYCPETKALAERVAAQSDAIELRSVTWRIFEDGFPNLFINNAHGIRGEHVAFLASFSQPGVIFEQLSVIYALPKLFVSSFTLVLPFFPTGTFERMEDEGDVATAFTLARILSNIPISRGGPTSIVTYDIHALQERFYFGDNILPCFESGIPLLKQRLQGLPDSDNIAIAFPDDGAWKRFHKQLQHFPVIICNKVRDGDKRIVRIKEGDPSGCHVVIVDDLVRSGGTLIECQKVLASHGALKISAYVTHGIFPNKTWERFRHDTGGNPGDGMTYFWITDSCPLTVQEVQSQRPFEILSLAGSIAAALQV